MKHDKGIEELTNRYLDLYRYAFSMLKNKADAEDVLHDAIATTLSYRNLKNPYGFCIRVVQYRSVDLLRKKGSIIELTENFSAANEEEDELCQKLIRLKDALSDRDKMLVEMHDMEGLSIREISKKTGIGESNIKRILIKIHKQMRKKCHEK